MEKILDPRGHSPEEILRAYEGLILQSVQKYGQSPDLWEDLKQEAALALLEGARDFDPDKGVAFPQYAKSKIKYGIFAYQRRAWAFAGRQAGEDEEGLEGLESGVDIEEEVLGKETGVLLWDRCKDLSPRQRQVLFLEYKEGLSLSEIAGFLGLAYKTVENTKQAGLKKLRRMYGLK